MNNPELIEQNVSDALLQRPIKLYVEDDNGKRTYFQIAPPTLGKMQILSKLYLQLEIDDKQLQLKPTETVMQVVRDKVDICATMMAVATFDKKSDLMNDEKISHRADFFKWACKPDDFTTVIIALISHVNYERFSNSIALTKILRLNAPMQKSTATGTIETSAGVRRGEK